MASVISTPVEAIGDNQIACIRAGKMLTRIMRSMSHWFHLKHKTKAQIFGGNAFVLEIKKFVYAL